MDITTKNEAGQFVSIYDLLKAKADESGLSLRQMCLKVGADPSTLQRWKRNGTKTVDLIREMWQACEDHASECQAMQAFEGVRTVAKPEPLQEEKTAVIAEGKYYGKNVKTLNGVDASEIKSKEGQNGGEAEWL